MSVKSSTELMLYVFLTMPTLNKAYLFIYYLFKLKDRKAFFMWYETNYRQRFDFQRELLSYCRSDVDILRRACLTFRQLFLEMTSGDGHGGIDPFQKCITIASACNLVFRTKFLRPDTIGIILAQGCRQEEKHSIKEMQWIKCLSTTEGVHIQQARNR